MKPLNQQPEVSIVMPCLNEERTLATCINKARAFLKRSHTCGEIIIADNGSTDTSVQIAQEMADRVVHIEAKGYGYALNGGIMAANGQYVVIGDADDSYDFSALDEFIRLLREGYDMVIGNRFSGNIQKRAMPWLHRYIGNPLLSRIGRFLFHNRIGDYHCGLRGFSKTAYLHIRPICGGMEFASEMIIKAVGQHLRITETSVNFYQDGRNRPPHLKTWSDGYSHLKLMLELFVKRNTDKR